MAQMKNVMTNLNTIAAPGITYYVYGRDYRANGASGLTQSIYVQLEDLRQYY